MNKKLSITGLALSLILLLNGCGSTLTTGPDSLSDISQDPYAPASNFSNAARLHVTANLMDVKAVNTYPQRVDAWSKSEPYDIEISIDHVSYFNLDNVPYRQYDYDETVRQYLGSSEKIQVDSKAITDIADSFAEPSASIQTIAGKALSWTKSNIEYDNNLADDIFGGTSGGRSADETIACRKGTCNEYTNVFIAFMRCLGIPARYVEGFWMTDSNSPMYHAWAEFYLEGYGWVPVDPMTGTWGQPPTYVKLFVGQDFVDIDVKLKDINAAYEEILTTP